MTEQEYISKIVQAVKDVRSGAYARIGIDENTKVYKCKNVVRIDITTNEEVK